MFNQAPNYNQASSPPPNQNFAQTFAQHPAYQQWLTKQYQEFLEWQKLNNMGPYAKGFYGTLGGMTAVAVPYAGFLLVRALFSGRAK